MRKLLVAAIASLALVLLLSAVASADFTVVNYQDTDNDYDSSGVIPTSLVRNGDFNAWTDGMPDFWTAWADTKTGWESAHLADVDLAFPASNKVGQSDAMGWFIRHTGGSGGYYAGAYQQLDLITEPGYYFVSVSESIWYNEQFATGPYNSVAWYAISPESDPALVTGWRELDPYVYQCLNGWELCNYAGRDETVWIDPGDYFHLKVGHNYPEFFAQTVFVLDDISIVAADGTDSYANGFYEWHNGDPDVKWHWADEPVPAGSAVTVAWDENAPR